MTEVKIKPLPSLQKAIKTAAPDILEMSLWALASFAASKALIFGRLSPFGAAAVAASKRNCALASAFGAIMGYVFSSSPESTMRYIASVLLVFGAKLVFERFASEDSVSVLNAGISTAFCSFGYAAMTVITGYGGVLAFAETVLAAGSAYFFRRTGIAFEHGKPVSALSGTDRACILMTAAIFVSSLTGITFGKISLGAVLASFVILTAAKNGRESGGAVAGIAAGTAVSAAVSKMSTVFPGYAVGGLICGIFSPFGKIGCAVSFVAARLIFCLLFASEYPDYTPLYESIIASVLFVLIPERTEKVISLVSLREDDSADSSTVRDLVLSKMGRAAEGLSDISLATKRVSAALEKENIVEMSTVLNSVAEKNCRRCSKSSLCWEKFRPETMKLFYAMGSAAKTNQNPPADADFTDRCPKNNDIYNDVKTAYADAVKNNTAERRIKNIRNVVTEQFDGMALLLRDVAAEAANVKSVDKKLSLAVKNVFESRNVPLFASTCYYTADGCMNIEVSGAKDRIKNIDLRSVTEEISDVCCRDMSKPVKRDTENARRLLFCEKPLVTPEFAKVSLNAKGEKFCGDSAEFFTDAYGCAHMILSDGMGSGEHAALDSMMACGLVARMIRAGFRFGSAIKLVNSALLLKSEDESLATIDAFSINLYTGAANFYKAGAEVSYVLKNGRPSKIENVSLPAGILGGAEYEQSSICLGAGDIAVLITDGVTAGGSDWIPSELRSLSEKTAEEIAEGIAKTAFSRRRDGHSDDITVVVMKLAENI